MNISDLADPDIISLGCSIINGTWKWDWLSAALVYGHVGWTTLPSVDLGDCLGISKNLTSAVVYPCSDPKRMLCTPS